ncbi:MAG: DUF192 domain-containing protein [Pseudomonadota bacterium]|nr:DUF192 domain-containing protein [Pseudomonadota bacterium]
MKFLAIAFCLMLPGMAFAYEAPLLYSRTGILIHRAAPPPVVTSLPWAKEVKTAPGNSDISFEVEVRDAMTMYRQAGWFDLSGLSDKSGALMAFTEPGAFPVVRMEQYAPLDILLIDEHGTIAQIIPNIVLADLRQDIVPPSPVLALLFLKGGLCEKLSIRPGDIVDYKLFSKPPAVLSAPQSASPPSSPAAPPSVAMPLQNAGSPAPSSPSRR